jgi:Sulfotransferase family
MGAGRSGSSTLGIALGNCSGVFYAGELDNWLVRSGTPQVEDAERSAFWAQVREQLRDGAAASSLFGYESQRSIERSLSLFRVNRWPTRWRLGTRYRAVADDLFTAIARVTGDGCIVDSSHYPLRARQLQQIDGLDLRLVLLARDPRAVVASFNRRDVGEFTKSTLHTNVYLWVTHLLSMIVFMRHPRARRLFVRYEDFVADPAGVVRQVLDLAGCPSASLPDFDALAVGVPLQGNRVTRLRTLALTRGGAPVRRSPGATAVVQAPLAIALARLRPRAGARSAACCPAQLDSSDRSE